MLEPVEGLEHCFELVGRNAGAAVRDEDPQRPAGRLFELDFGGSGEFQRIVDQVGQDTPQRMRARHHDGVDGLRHRDRLAGVLIVEGDALDEGTEIDARRLLGVAIGALGIGDAFAHEALDLGEIVDELVLLRAVLRHLRAQLHPGDRCLQVMRDGSEDLDALLQVLRDSVPHGVEGRRRIGDLGRPVLVEPRGLAVRVEGFGSAG